MQELKETLDKFLYNQLENTNISENDKWRLKTEMQLDIELEIEKVLIKANRFLNGEIPKYNILI